MRRRTQNEANRLSAKSRPQSLRFTEGDGEAGTRRTDVRAQWTQRYDGGPPPAPAGAFGEAPPRHEPQTATSCPSPKLTKKPELGEPMSERNGHSAMTAVRLRRLQEPSVKQLRATSRSPATSCASPKATKKPELGEPMSERSGHSAKARTQSVRALG